MTGTFNFAIIFIIAFVLIGVLVVYLSRNIDHGEAQFDTRNRTRDDEEAGE